MRTDIGAGFDPAELKLLYGAFDTAWDSLKESTNVADQERVREVMGKTIFGLARHGYKPGAPGDARRLSRQGLHRPALLKRSQHRWAE